MTRAGARLLPLLVGLLLLILARDGLAEKRQAGAKQPKSIVVLAQGRSGSSFLSSWFGAHPNITYFIEPCSLTYVKRAVRDKTGSGCAKILQSLARCDFSLVDYNRDMSMMIPEAAKGFKGWGHQRGAEDIELCKERVATVSKELRVGFAWAESKVSFDRVLVLLRDPRAVVNSRVTGWPPRNTKLADWEAEPIGWDGRRGFPYDQSLKSLCLEHLKLRDRISASRKDDAMLIEYSDLLKDASGLLKRVMNFAGLELVPEVTAFVNKYTKGDCEHADLPFSVCRSSIPRRDEKWKKTLPKEHLDDIMATPECAKVIQQFYSETKQVDEL